MNSIYLLATRKKYDLNMFKDIYHLITNNPNSITPESLHKIGVEYKILSYIYYVLYFTNYIYNSPILNRYLDAIKQTDFNDIINYYGLCVSERKKWPCDISKRLYSENLYELIENDLSQKDFDKINLNKQYFSDIL